MLEISKFIRMKIDLIDPWKTLSSNFNFGLFWITSKVAA